MEAIGYVQHLVALCVGIQCTKGSDFGGAVVVEYIDRFKIDSVYSYHVSVKESNRNTH